MQTIVNKYVFLELFTIKNVLWLNVHVNDLEGMKNRESVSQIFFHLINLLIIFITELHTKLNAILINNYIEA
jgi:hypothetical protein